jgi:hypothetical protein
MNGLNGFAALMIAGAVIVLAFIPRGRRPGQWKNKGRPRNERTGSIHGDFVPS